VRLATVVGRILVSHLSLFLENDVLTGGMMDWMQGFISGINITAFERKKYYNLKAISIDEQWGYVIDFCHRNPDKRFYQAVLDLIAKRLEVPPVAPAQ
jgi:hypothetical protein